LGKLGFQVLKLDEDKEKIIIAKIDTLAEEVANLKITKDIKWRILDFYNYKNTLEDKEIILGLMYQTFEKYRKKMNQEVGDVVADIMSHCIRHTKKLQPYDFYLEDREKWVQNLYDLFLALFIQYENKSILKEYKEEKAKIESTKGK
jgi:hypothetical protein